MTTFALIHGGELGGWLWEPVIRELEARGHRAVAPDMPREEPDAGAREYAQAVLDSLDGSDDDVIVVGHSLGGLTVPVVASLRPVRRMVFVGALVPAPGQVFTEFLATQTGAVTSMPEPAAYDERGLRKPRTWEVARPLYMHDLPEDLARSAWRRMGPQNGKIYNEPSPMERWPDVPSTYVLLTDDQALGHDWLRRVARERLGVEVVEIPGSHMGFVADPVPLAEVLAGLA
jgi:pimeloyl-ACP methyl ester carboxylesterase